MEIALGFQKQYLPLADLEPQLWYKPFHASAYQGMVDAQEEVNRPCSYFFFMFCFTLLPLFFPQCIVFFYYSTILFH